MMFDAQLHTVYGQSNRSALSKQAMYGSIRFRFCIEPVQVTLHLLCRTDVTLCLAAAQPSVAVACAQVGSAATLSQFRQFEAVNVFSVFNLFEKLRMPNFARGSTSV